MKLPAFLTELLQLFSPRSNLNSVVAEPLDWRPESWPASLEKVKQVATCKARSAIDWYYRGKRGKKAAAWIFRVGVILLSAAAGIVPLANEIEQGRQVRRYLAETWRAPAEGVTPGKTATNAPNPGTPPVPFLASRPFDPVWSAVLLAVAATLLALDRFHGATSGWVRYIRTAQKIGEDLDDFEWGFESLKIDWAGGKPTAEQARAALVLAQNFIRQVNVVVREETNVWATEFTEAAKQIDEQIKSAQARVASGTLRVKVSNGEQCTGPWQLTVGTQPSSARRGNEASIEMPPGIHRVQVAGSIAGKAVQAEDSVTVPAGGAVEVTLVLK